MPNFNLEKFNCDFAYSMDGGELESSTDDSFQLRNCLCRGKRRGSPYGICEKNRMVNSMHIAMELHSLLNPLEIPATGRKEKALIIWQRFTEMWELPPCGYLVRDHEMSKFTEKKNALLTIAEFLNKKYGENTVNIALRTLCTI